MTTATSTRIIAATPAGGRRISVTFAGGGEAVVDVEPLLHGPVFKHIVADDVEFARLYLDAQLGTICWPGGVDLAPEALAALPDVGSRDMDV